MGYPELIRVLGEEAAREAREIREGAEREATRILVEATEAAAAARAALVAREQAEAAARQRTAVEGAALERERALLVEGRRLIEDLRAEIVRRLPAAGGAELDERLLGEVLAEAGAGPLELVVDPGLEGAARAVVVRIDPGAASRAIVRAAPAPRGGVLAVAGRRELDDTLPSRLERAWPTLEVELAAILFAEV